MRAAILAFAVLAASPALAWQAGVEGRLCTLTHSGAEAEVRLTYDPAGPLYTITLTRPAPWPDSPRFAIRFEGGRALTIGTDRHSLGDGGRSLTVADTGFGNVLYGLEYNATATAVAGDGAATLDLTGAAPEVRAFRDCTAAPAV